MSLSNRNHSEPDSADLCVAAALLAGLERCELERLAAPLRPGVEIGEAQWPTLALLALIDAELERRRA